MESIVEVYLYINIWPLSSGMQLGGSWWPRPLILLANEQKFPFCRALSISQRAFFWDEKRMIMKILTFYVIVSGLTEIA